MSVLLLILGVATAAVGAVMVGFGVPINEFSLGNTLIVAGTTAFVGGLIVVALSFALRTLSRIAELLKTRPVSMPARPAGMADVAAPAPVAAAPNPVRLPFPPREAPRTPDVRFAEPEEPADPIFERLRMEHKAARRTGDTPVVEDSEASLSPRAPSRAPAPAIPVPVPEPAFERAESRAPKFDVEREAALDAPRAPAAEPAIPDFEDTWPAPARGPRNDAGDPFAGAAVMPRSNGAARREREERGQSTAVSILKSGVVDGMAYTLYTDGSIEAELAQGVVRFGSIEELRNHLEKGA